MLIHKYIKAAEEIVRLNNGKRPFVKYLKAFFYVNKKFGANDRRNVSQICYIIYRLGKAAQEYNFETQSKIGMFLMRNNEKNWLDVFDKEWLPYCDLSLKERINFIEKQFPWFNSLNIVPYQEWFSAEMDVTLYQHSFLHKPHFFIRIRPFCEAEVIKKLESSNINYHKITYQAISFQEPIDLDKFFTINREVVIQDYNSQRVSGLFNFIEFQPNKPIEILDACAGGGGKTILLHDYFTQAKITVNDIRIMTLQSLEKRMLEADIKLNEILNYDLNIQAIPKKYNLIVLDAPCSGSGTWVRTPELIYFYKKSMFYEILETQQNIIKNSMLSLEENGYLLYITCSVFKDENEGQVKFILDNYTVDLIIKKYFWGYDFNGDTIFVALFKKKAVS
ncbi:MAG: hypothetical protein ORN85_10810 [Sediminibacterium sp.]|nr:hypothetical protein [Sediminibacterium sp.]